MEFFLIQKGIVAITKELQKISLHPTTDLFKEYFEAYVEKGSEGYINNIGKHRWDAKFHSEFMPIVCVFFIFYFVINIIILLVINLYNLFNSVLKKCEIAAVHLQKI